MNDRRKILSFVWSCGACLMVMACVVMDANNITSKYSWIVFPAMLGWLIICLAVDYLYFLKHQETQPEAKPDKELQIHARSLFFKQSDGEYQVVIQIVTPRDRQDRVSCLPIIGVLMGIYCKSNEEGLETSLEQLQKACLDYLKRNQGTPSP